MTDHWGVVLRNLANKNWNLYLARRGVELLKSFCKLGKEMLHRYIVEPRILYLAVIRVELFGKKVGL